MPYIHCEMCGTACYSNVLSCPTCGARARLARTRGLVQLAMAGAPGLRGRTGEGERTPERGETPGLRGGEHERTTLRERIERQLRDRTLHAPRAAPQAPHAPDPPCEEIEDEVRERLYGWHSGCVELCDGKDVA